ncbi:initiation factor 2B [Desulfurococcaceae archaeon MEX13E-LK6-19]|nr:initiation factor 2B [Desulfurococcaceae archaeon MEX13E-LK6-19]
MDFIEELKKHGFNIGFTATEYSLKLLDEIRASFEKTTDYKSLARAFIDIVEKTMLERPTSAQAHNILRDLGLIIAEGYEDNIMYDKTRENLFKSIELWRRKVVEECNEAALIASRRLLDGEVVMTNSRSICVLKAFEYAANEGKRLTVYVTESRPGMEGLITAEKIAELGHKVKLIVDSGARYFMKDVDKVLMGSEAVAINGAVISKVGSSLISLIAYEARVRVFYIAPTTKFSIETLFGELVKLPEGDWRRLMSPDVFASMPENYNARAPLFDVTPPNYIDGIATEQGLFAPQALPVVLKEVYGSWPPSLPSIEEVVEKVKQIYQGV